MGWTTSDHLERWSNGTDKLPDFPKFPPPFQRQRSGKRLRNPPTPHRPEPHAGLEPSQYPPPSQPFPSPERPHGPPTPTTTQGKEKCTGLLCRTLEKPRIINPKCRLCAKCCKHADRGCPTHSRTSKSSSKDFHNTLASLVLGSNQASSSRTSISPSKSGDSDFRAYFPGMPTTNRPELRIDPDLLGDKSSLPSHPGSQSPTKSLPASSEPATDIRSLLDPPPSSSSLAGTALSKDFVFRVPEQPTILEERRHHKMIYSKEKRGELARDATAIALRKQVTIRVWDVRTFSLPTSLFDGVLADLLLMRINTSI